MLFSWDVHARVCKYVMHVCGRKCVCIYIFIYSVYVHVCVSVMMLNDDQQRLVITILANHVIKNV